MASQYTLEQQIACVRREVALRERAYPRWVANAKMKPERSVFELGAMRAVLATLEGVQERGESELTSRPGLEVPCHTAP